MKTVKTIFVLITALLCGSCDDRFDFLESTNTPPVLEVRKRSGDQDNLLLLKDSVKVGLKATNLPYEFRIIASDKESKLKTLSYQFLNGNGTLTQGSSDLSGSIDISTGEALINFIPEDFGSVLIEVTAEDDFQKKVTGRIELLIFENLPPVALFTETKIGVLSPFEYEFNAQASYDADRYQGGGIQAYHYTINGTYEITTTLPKIRHIFSGVGGQEVKLEVIDNNGIKSPIFTKLVTVN